MNNRERLLLLAGASFGAMSIGVVSHAQVSMPKTGTLNSAQPVFCVNPTTGVIEDCVSSTTIGNVSLGNSTSNIGNVIVSSGNITATPPANITVQVTNTPAVTVTSGNITATPPANITVIVSSGNISNTPQGQENYPNRSNWVGNTTTVANTTQASIIPSPGAGNSIFVTDLSCLNSGNTTVNATFTDQAGTVLIVPTGGGVVDNLQTPHEVAGNTALQVTLSGNTTSVVCTVSGYKAAT